MVDNPVTKTQQLTDAQTESRLSRRRLLATSAAVTTALLGGVAGTASAKQETGRFNESPGRGGQAVVPATDFREKAFRITDRTGDTASEIDGALFSCNEGDGGQIFLVGWYFEYVDDQQRLLFTRSNNIDTDRTFSWSTEGAKQCDDSGIVLSGNGHPENFVQTSYRATGPQ